MDMSDAFSVTIEPDFLDRVSFRSEAVNDSTSIHVTATSGVAAAWGLNHYVKYYLGGHVSWDFVRIRECLYC